jgi:hypothetical protein|tara:strand:+ start:252 stop:563 length:312 start_codon:yes stop_codon:yes gene_type:complete
MLDLDDHNRREKRDSLIYSGNWIPDKQARSMEADEELFQLELDFLSGKASHPAECKGCPSLEPSDCHYCEKRTFTILWDTIKGNHGRKPHPANNTGWEKKEKR